MAFDLPDLRPGLFPFLLPSAFVSPFFVARLTVSQFVEPFSGRFALGGGFQSLLPGNVVPLSPRTVPVVALSLSAGPCRGGYPFDSFSRFYCASPRFPFPAVFPPLKPQWVFGGSKICVPLELRKLFSGALRQHSLGGGLS